MRALPIDRVLNVHSSGEGPSQSDAATARIQID
jgi:hypothetical protein